MFINHKKITDILRKQQNISSFQKSLESKQNFKNHLNVKSIGLGYTPLYQTVIAILLLYHKNGGTKRPNWPLKYDNICMHR